MNTLLARFENLADLYDYPATATLDDTVIYLDLDKFARGLYAKVNGEEAQLSSVVIEEYEISGIITEAAMLQKKAQWKGEDDGKITPPIMPKDKDQNNIALSAQRIR